MHVDGGCHCGSIKYEAEVDPHVHAAVAEVPVRHAVEAVLAQQLVEVAQPGPEVLGRHGGVLPAGVGRRGQAASGQPGAQTKAA